MKTHAIMVWAAVSLSALACTRKTPEPVRPAAHVVRPDLQQLAAASGQELTLEPSVSHLGQPILVRIKRGSLEPGTAVHVSLFGPNHWLIHHFQTRLAAEDTTATVPALSFRNAGRYRATLRSGSIPLGQASIVVLP